MNILVVGSGGREHAISWKLSQSSKCDQLYIAPGNAGTNEIGTNVDIQVNDFEKISSFILSKNIDLLIVGPEDPLVNGIRDLLESMPEHKNLKIIGPGKEGAELEGSKDFCKDFLLRYNIPTAAAKTFHSSELDDAIEYLKTIQPPYVLKADGLAAGKGVIITSSIDEAEENLKGMMVDKRFGNAGDKVLIEQYLDGIELSVFVLTDGTHYLILPEAKDYKRIGEGDTGPNTGGMGSISPVPFANDTFLSKVENSIVKPTVLGLKQDGIDYCGFIFIGLMKVGEDPYVIEYNVRMGDPETQSVFPRIESDIVEMFEACADRKLDQYNMKISPETSTSVVMVAEGYPGKYEKGKDITGLDSVQGSIVFHAGTKDSDSRVLTNGGRVLAVTSLSTDMESALQSSYENINKISWDGYFYRKDIGKDLLSLKNQ